MLKRTIWLCIATFLSITVFGQKDTLVISYGDERLNGKFLTNYTNKWKVTFVNADGSTIPNRIWTDYGNIIELDNKSYLHRVQDLYDPQMNLQDTWINMVEQKTLAPQIFTSISPNGTHRHYKFNGNNISGKVKQPNEEAIATDTTFNQGVYDWNLYGMLLVGLPLAEGLIARIPIYSAQTNGLDWLTANVVGREDAQLDNSKSISTWKVITDKSLTFWLTKSAPYVIKLELQLPNDTKLIWEMI